ncbi:MAG: type III pantothenate kinase, partial [Erysipelotrichaceae bacterium]
MNKNINILAIDLGNTDLTMRLYLKAEAQEIVREPIKNLTNESLIFLLTKLINKVDVDVAGISCVVPRLKDLLLKVVGNFAAKVIIVDASLLSDIVINADQRNELGADFLSVYYGCINKYKLPILVYDLGSASKSMLINKAGAIEGVTIKAGIDNSYHNMVKDIPHLPYVEMHMNDDPLGHNTITAIQTGILHGELGWIINSTKKIESYYKIECTKVITGGCSRYLVADLNDYNYDPDIILTGIYYIVLRSI